MLYYRLIKTLIKKQVKNQNKIVLKYDYELWIMI